MNITNIRQMSLRSFIFFCLSLLLLKNGFVDGTITVVEVPAGHLAELPCLSSDDHHRFMFWQLTDDRRIIGPGNPMDENKYNYEVLTGKLFIRGVSTAESGFYKCASKGISDHSTINIHVVELIVKKDWEDVWENDFETNLLRGMAAAMVVIVTIAVILFIITSRRRRNRRFFDFEESRENSPAKYTPNVSVAPTLPTPIVEEDGIDNAALDIDFPRVLRQMQK
ncbi:uncharacterized protein LOC143341079 isoform X1 [Colletes latitarsis]|uniref:uncharacterized protein LOC143341079 isoform X1 n=2 Tax=Colletes latitarsis TaxID=2605962 RepID=UPI0040355572